MNITRLGPGDAQRIVDCFRRVYGDSYANELYYDTSALAAAIAAGRVGCVGARSPEGALLAHMAMTHRPGAPVVELGNTVVDPAARGQGLAWKVGAALSDWCRELEYQGFLHYPTTDHHIMQRQSVQQGVEVGLMLGYIPAETFAQVGAEKRGSRQAATIVYEAYRPGAPAVVYLPECCSERLQEFAVAAGLSRRWQVSKGMPAGGSDFRIVRQHKRGLDRLSVRRTGTDVAERISELTAMAAPARQIDFLMSDPAIEHGVRAALAAGYWFCGWLPGYGSADVYRLQAVNRPVTDMSPELINPVARSLLAEVPAPTAERKA